MIEVRPAFVNVLSWHLARVPFPSRKQFIKIPKRNEKFHFNEAEVEFLILLSL